MLVFFSIFISIIKRRKKQIFRRVSFSFFLALFGHSLSRFCFGCDSSGLFLFFPTVTCKSDLLLFSTYSIQYLNLHFVVLSMLLLNTRILKKMCTREWMPSQLEMHKWILVIHAILNQKHNDKVFTNSVNEAIPFQKQIIRLTWFRLVPVNQMAFNKNAIFRSFVFLRVPIHLM